MKDKLFLLRPGFLDGEKNFFCAGCATVEGMMSFYPKLREVLEVHYIRFQRPRPEIVAELGPEHQSAPCLLLANTDDAKGAPPSVRFEYHNGRMFVNEPVEICEYLAWKYGTDPPHP